MTGVFNKQTKLRSKFKTSLLNFIFKANLYFILLFLLLHKRRRVHLPLPSLMGHSCF